METSTVTSPTRASELSRALSDIRSRVKTATSSSSTSPQPTPILIAVSKYKPASDVQTCFENGQLDFGENYVQELGEKAAALPLEIRWHFIGALQSNKVKTLAAIPNLETIQTLTSLKTAKALNKALPQDRKTPLKILLQVNTSNEASKSGVPPIRVPTHEPGTTTPDVNIAESELAQLTKGIILECPRLRVQGLMTIGALEQSLTVSASASEGEMNTDFERLKETRDLLEAYLVTELGRGDGGEGKWGQENRLLLSMGMSSDFEAAIKAGSDIVRVGTGIFGDRRKKEE